MVLGFIHVVNWGGYALEVIPLKALTMIGLDSTPTQERMTQICLDVKRYDCAEQMMARMASHDKNAYLRLGKFQFSRMKYADAAESYRQFFGSGGQNLDAAYFYARALGEIGHVDESAKYFDYVLSAKPDVLQVTVASNYVKMLVLHGRLDQSLRVIQAIRHRGASARSFMDSEYKVIEARLGHRSS
jgi:tetratricopeptide (TPR) repeat protein